MIGWPREAERITLANDDVPPAPGPNTLQTHPTFHGDARALYQVADGRDPVSERWLLSAALGGGTSQGPDGGSRTQ